MKNCIQESSLKIIEGRIDVEFRNKGLLWQALTHRSHMNECQNHPSELGHNERLEFLGDAVLELVVTDFLYRKYPNEAEGVLTEWRSALVCSKACAQIFQELELEPFILMSTGEAKDANSKARGYILANALEALIGAIYLDQGLGTSRLFIDAFVLVKTSRIIEEHRDYKSELQEMSQEQFKLTPEYRIISETGLPHARTYVTACILGAHRISTGEGTSKQEAKIAAAKTALETKQQWERLVEREADTRSSTMRRSRRIVTTNG